MSAIPPPPVATSDPVARLSAGSRGWLGRVTLAAVVAPALFIVVMIVLGLVTPGYNPLARYWSELSLGPLGPVMIANFIVLGLVELALAVALGRTITDRASGWVAAVAVGVLGAAFVTAGVCVTDPATLVGRAHTWHGVVHAFMAVVIFFLTTPIAGLSVAWRFRKQHGFAAYSALTAVATPGLLVLTFVSGSLIGLTEGIVIAVALAWLTALATRIRRRRIPQPDTSTSTRAI